MAKPGLKITKENTYKLNATGAIFIDDGKAMMDISEDADGSDVIELLPYIIEMNDQLITLTIKKVEELE
jgi:hypothetical protein